MELPTNIEPTPVDTLAEVAQANGFDCAHLRLAIEVDDDRVIRISDRTLIGISDGDRVAVWQVPSLRPLLRGDRKPPDLRSPPDEYMLFMFPIEEQVLAFAAATGHPATDDDIRDAFSTIRRRPDGRSLGLVHDVLWQAVALAVGLRPVSAAELSAIMSRLELSARRWRQFAGSTAYSEFLRDHLHGDR